ncbi:MAG TPA: S8 family serine peptidase [Planctomycetota bacterium]|nr:S8 family serine peptidase [Planctomycetota bacterium]
MLLAASGSVAAVDFVMQPLVGGAGSAPGAKWLTPTAGPATSEVLIFLEPGTDAEAFAQEHNLVLKSRLVSDPDACVFEAASVEAAGSLAEGAAGDARVRSAHLNQQLQVQQMAFVPDDPYFPKNAPLLGQWHLVNQHVAGRDIHVQGAWNRDLTGSGVTIGFVDDGIDTTHEDLSANYVSGDSYDFGEGDADPSPHTDDDHGTATSGLAAARGGNGTGVTGVAPMSGIAMMRVDFDCSSVTQFVDATLYHSSGANTDVKIKSHSYGYTTAWGVNSGELTALITSHDCGTIHTWAAGNSGIDVNKMGLTNRPEALVVAGLSSDDDYVSYSNFGANVFCTSYTSSNDTPTQFDGITTTDRTGASAGYNPPDDLTDTNYTTTFGGTSACAPTVAGVMALGRQVQPNLDTRLAKHILARTCDVVDPGDTTYYSDGGWQTNGAGLQFNQNYGFGRINADAFTKGCELYTGVTPLVVWGAEGVVDYDIPDGDPTLDGFIINMGEADPVEEVILAVDVTHDHQGDLEFYVLSPQGTLGRMCAANSSDSGTGYVWLFTSNLFWGEDPEGIWAILVCDLVSGNTGTWNAAGFYILTGDVVPEPGTWALVGTGALLVFGIMRRRRMRER